ncbi:hypothetical protein K6119_06405 [Paracrocinitomix mangrovi]|uniref:two-component regulator propeller domain-containing protein n=1 Tax=Paracrocinitomix mangrovi TaxID=2862509 RepID=UPI001C8D4296|nr:two-component regulator propeller domain-containing protein [Paracrocinitomix mangrovi]UKN03144.1 hypothetical protein K6119_06405 [Paracrocinitomix mangrovi]
MNPKFLFFILLGLLLKSTYAQDKCSKIDHYLSQAPEFNSIQNLIDELVLLEDYKSALYFIEQQRLLNPNEMSDTNEKLYQEIKRKLDQSKDCGCDFKLGNYQAANGPQGADATAFYEDNDGNYWMGTGSSGGVYFSSNKGKSWKVKNNGIGPWHIVDFLFEKDTLYIQVNNMPVDIDGKPRIYAYHKSEDRWAFVDGAIERNPEYCVGRAGEIYLKMIQNNSDPFLNKSANLNYTDNFNSQYSYSTESYYWQRSVNPEFGFVPYYYEKGRRVFGYIESTPEMAQLNHNFPRDMFTLPRGNQYTLKDDSKLLLSKSGLYQVENMKEISPLSMSGVVATDVRQLVNNNGVLYALVNEADIWQYKKGKWKKVFDAYQHHIKMDDPISRTGYDTKELNLQKDGSILFSFCGKLWELSSSGKAKAISIDFSKIESKYLDPRVIIESSGYDMSGNLYVLIQLYDIKKKDKDKMFPEPYFSYQMICKVVDGKAELFDDSKNYYNCLFNDKNGLLWVSGDGVYTIGEGSVSQDILHGYSNGYMNRYCFLDNGDFLHFNQKGVWKWLSERRRWDRIITQPPPHGAACVASDADGTVYIGTGDLYSHGCGESPVEGKSSGIYKWDGDNWVPILGNPNPWTYAMVPSEKNGLAIGTGGSGVVFLKSK